MVKTLTFQIDPPADRTLHLQLPPDMPSGRLEIVLVIAPAQSIPTTSLAGRWQTYFPLDFDIDTALQDLRHSWEGESLVDE